MKFTSNSVMLNGGVPHRVNVNIPMTLNRYDIDESVWIDAVEDFNIQLDNRKSVTIESFMSPTIKMDILTMHRLENAISLRLVVEQNKINEIDITPFTLTGKVIFADRSDTKVEKMIIQNITDGHGNSILEEKS